MKGDRYALVPKAVLLLSILVNGFLLAAVMALLCSCGGSRNRVEIVRSLEEAKKLAAEKNTWIVAEFWRHG